MLNRFFIEEHVKAALQEDIGFGDITTDYLTTENDTMSCVLNSRVDGIFCGKEVFETVFKILSPKVNIKFYFNDGDVQTLRIDYFYASFEYLTEYTNFGLLRQSIFWN